VSFSYEATGPALTTGLVRRIRGELPLAFAKINAELAFSYLSCGKREEAEWHVSFLKYANRGNRDMRNILEALLTPTETKIRLALESIEKALRAEPGNGVVQAERFIKTVHLLLERIELLHVVSEWQPSDECDGIEIKISHDLEYMRFENALHEEVVETALTSAITGVNTIISRVKLGQKNHLSPQDQSLTDILKLRAKIKAQSDFILVLESLTVNGISDELFRRIDTNINLAKAGIRQDTHISPLMNQLASITEDDESVSLALVIKFRESILPAIDKLKANNSLVDEELAQLRNAAATTLRVIAVKAHNRGCSSIALQAAELALQYSEDPDLLKKIKTELEIFRRVMSERGRKNENQWEDHEFKTIMRVIVISLVIAYFIFIASTYNK
jgi:hypothetical protein